MQRVFYWGDLICAIFSSDRERSLVPPSFRVPAWRTVGGHVRLACMDRLPSALPVPVLGGPGRASIRWKIAQHKMNIFVKHI